MQDRKAVFPKLFETYLKTQEKVTHQLREQRRYPDPTVEGGFRFSQTNWEDVVEPSYKSEILPQTLTQEDIDNDRWPASVWRYEMEDGRVLMSFVVETRDYGSDDSVLDFMGIRDLSTNEDLYTWTKEEINKAEESERRLQAA